MTKPKYPSEKLDQYMLRLPAGMRDRIKAMAEVNGRSMNAEIVLRLEQAFSTKENQAQFFAKAVADAFSHPSAEVHVHLDNIPPEKRDDPKWINYIEVRFQDGGYMAVPRAPHLRRDRD